jgi:hypothetical protein
MAKRTLKTSHVPQAGQRTGSNGEGPATLPFAQPESAELLPAAQAAAMLDSVPVIQPAKDEEPEPITAAKLHSNAWDESVSPEQAAADAREYERQQRPTSTHAETHSAPTPTDSEAADLLPSADDVISGPCTYCGDPNHWRPDCPKIAAHVVWQQQLQAAKDDHLQACLELESAQNTVKGLRERAKDALSHYRELEARGPVVTKPVDPISSVTPASSPLPVDSDDENGWRLVTLDSLPLDTIRGLGGKKREALLDCCPNLGAFIDKQVEAGASPVSTVLPKGIGKAITDPLEEMVLNAVTAWNQQRQNGQEASQDGVTAEPAAGGTEGEQQGKQEITGALPSFTEWELFTDEQRHDWLMTRACQISESPPPEKLTAAWQSGQLAYSRGDEAKHCPHIPGEEMDEWLTGFFAAAADDDDASRDSLADEPAIKAVLADRERKEPELAAASPASSLASSSLFNLDDI